MIFELLFIALIGFINLLTVWLPDGLTLPYGLDNLFIRFVGTIHVFFVVFPPLVDVMFAVTIYIGFRLVLLILRMILGSRVPSSID